MRTCPTTNGRTIILRGSNMIVANLANILSNNICPLPRHYPTKRGLLMVHGPRARVFPFRFPYYVYARHFLYRFIRHIVSACTNVQSYEALFFCVFQFFKYNYDVLHFRPAILLRLHYLSVHDFIFRDGNDVREQLFPVLAMGPVFRTHLRGSYPYGHGLSVFTTPRSCFTMTVVGRPVFWTLSTGITFYVRGDFHYGFSDQFSPV